MGRQKRIDSNIFIANLFRNLSRMKSIPVVLMINNNQFIANMNFSAKKGNTPSIEVDNEDFHLSEGEKVKISLSDKELNISFETVSTSSSLGSSFDIEIPKLVLAAFPDIQTSVDLIEHDKTAVKTISLKNVSKVNIEKILKNSGSENSPVNSKLIKEISSKLEAVKNNKQLFYGFSYKPEMNHTAIGSVLRNQKSTYFGNGFICMNQEVFEPDPWTKIYSGLSGKLLTDPNCEYCIIDIPDDWQLETMEHIDRFINNHDNFLIDKSDSFLCNISTVRRKTKKIDYICEQTDNLQPFLEFCKSKINPLIVKANDFTKDGFFGDEINKIYEPFGYYKVRKPVSIKKKNDTIAYAVMEVNSDVLNFNGYNDTVRIYFKNENPDIKKIIPDLLPIAVSFFKEYGKKKFRIVLNAEKHSINNFEDLGIEFERKISEAIMSKMGLNDFRLLLQRNFIDFNKYYRLTYPQMAIWQTEKFYPGTGFGNIVGNSFIDDDIDFEMLEKSINLVVRKNDGYGIRVVEEGETVRQYFKKYNSFKVDFFDFSLIGGLEAFEKWNETKTQEPFKLLNSRLYYIAVFKISKNYCGIYYKMHHLISDAWTSVTNMSKAVEYYYKMKNDIEISDKKEPSYIDFIMSEDEYLNSVMYKTHKEFWNRKFETVPEFTSLIPTGTVYRNIKSERKTKVLSKKVSEQIKDFCAKYKSSPLTLFLALMFVYIYRITSKSDIVIGTPVLNRSNAREKNIAGMFISVVPVRFSIDGEMDFVSFVGSLAKDFSTLLRNQKYPFDLIQCDFREKHKVSENLFDTMVSFQNVKIENEDLERSHKIDWVFNGYQTDSLQLHIGDRGNTGEYELDFDYLAEAFTDSNIERVSSQLINMLEETLNQPDKIINDFDVIPDSEREKLLYEFNDTDKEYPDMTIHELFEIQAARTPDNVALVFDGKEMTYSELNKRTNSLALDLREKGVKPDDIVGLMIDRSFEMIIGMLGILKAGGAYLPLDRNYPDDRLNYMIEDSKCKLILTQKSNTKKLNFKGSYVYLESENFLSGSAVNIKNVCTKDNLAYVIYTSGSTGQPKGVMVEHKGISSLKVFFEKDMGVSEKDKIIQFSSCSFDASVWEISMALLTGATLNIITKEVIENYIKFENYLNDNNITVATLPPSYLSNINPEKVKTLKVLITAGSSITNSLMTKWCQKVLYINAYGPTESTICATIWKSTDKINETEAVPIGKPIYNTRIYIVNKFGNLQPIGVPGELCISGDTLARGYLGKDELTKEKFAQCKFGKDKIMYKTGDLAKWLPDGNIEYLGRIDNQVKIRGFRVEMGEIENVLLSHDEIIDAIVIDKKDESDDSYLCAYVVLQNDMYTESELKNYLSGKLPGFMVPSFIIKMDLLPLNTNGKVDKKLLPEPSKKNEHTYQETHPTNSVEKELLAVWKDALNVKNIGVNDNIFELGADSLAIMRVLTGTFKFGWDITMQDFYECRTIRELANKILGNNIENLIPKVEDIQEIEIYNLTEIPDSIKSSEKIKNVLLTGATGFLGIHILSNILEFTKAKVYCIIRGEDSSEAKSKLREKLIFYFGNTYYNQLINKRIIVLNGDITLKLLGLSKSEYDKLVKTIDTTIHTAALVKHFGDYSVFEKTNIIGTKRIIDFCGLSGSRLNHISTISVAGDFFDEGEHAVKFTENDLYIGQNLGDNVYLKSKFEAEKMILESVKKGLNVSIFRVGNLTGRYTDGKFQSNMENNRFYNLLKFFVTMEMVSTDMQDWELELTPVDICAFSIVELLKLQSRGAKIFHLYNPKKVGLKKVVESFNLLGSKIDFVENESYRKRIGQIANDDDSMEMLLGVINDLSRDGIFRGATPLAVSCESTESIMLKIGISWPDIDSEYLGKIFKHMGQVGFIS